MDNNYRSLLDQRWAKQKGNYLVGLLDLPDHFLLDFSKDGKEMLSHYYNFLKRKKGIDAIHRETKRNLYTIHYYLSSKSKQISVKSIKNFIRCSTEYDILFDIDKLQKEVRIISSGRHGVIFRPLIFPIDLRRPEWGTFFGIIFDSKISRFEFCSAYENMTKGIKKSFNKLGFAVRVTRLRGVNRLSLGRQAPFILSFAGFDVSKPQMITNNPLPHWIVYNQNKEFIGALLAGIIDTEGNIHIAKNKKGGMVRIAQNRLHPLIGKEELTQTKLMKYNLLNHSMLHYTFFNNLSTSLKQKILNDPPLLLVSLQLLLELENINSSLYPLQVYLRPDGSVCSAWQLIISRKKNLEKILSLTENYLILKKEKLNKLVNRYTRDVVSPGDRFISVLSPALRIQQEKGYFTTPELIKTTKRKGKTIQNIVGILASKQLIHQIGKNRKIKKWVITQEGLHLLK